MKQIMIHMTNNKPGNEQIEYKLCKAQLVYTEINLNFINKVLCKFKPYEKKCIIVRSFGIINHMFKR